MYKKVIIKDKMQTGHYYLSQAEGENFDPNFTPDLTPKEMLALGVFGGKYLTDCLKEFPSDWFTHAKLATDKKDISLNFFKINASLSLKEWQDRGWIYPEDPRGWFQWYCRYYYGRRIPLEDQRQIKRWKGIRRHVGAVKKNCLPFHLECRKKQRQALLHWAYDSRNF